MNAVILAPAEEDLTQAFEHYESIRQGLGVEFVLEFRRAVERILEYPRGWNALDAIYRRYRLHRFPYGIVYRVDDQMQQIVIGAVMQLNRRPEEHRTGF